jgi:hypothetical protein
VNEIFVKKVEKNSTENDIEKPTSIIVSQTLENMTEISVIEKVDKNSTSNDNIPTDCLKQPSQAPKVMKHH